jgi:hypothetical protein
MMEHAGRPLTRGPERLNALSTSIMQGLLDGLPRLAGDPAVKALELS